MIPVKLVNLMILVNLLNLVILVIQLNLVNFVNPPQVYKGVGGYGFKF